MACGVLLHYVTYHRVTPMEYLLITIFMALPLTTLAKGNPDEDSYQSPRKRALRRSRLEIWP